MSTMIPVPRGFQPHTGEISGLTGPRESGGLNRMWSRVSDQRNRAGATTNNGSLFQTQINRKGQKFNNIPSRLHPFRIYQVPYVFQVTNINDPTQWRQFRVRTGYVYPQGAAPFIPTGTDAVLNPDIETYLDKPTTAAASQFTADNNVLQYWVWIDVADKVIRHSASPARLGWTAFPSADAAHIPIGFIDTQTFNAQGIANVRQLVRSDINVFFSSSSGVSQLGFDGQVHSMCLDNSNPALIYAVGEFSVAFISGNSGYTRSRIAVMDDKCNLTPAYYGVVNNLDFGQSCIHYTDGFQDQVYVSFSSGTTGATLELWVNGATTITNTGSQLAAIDQFGNVQVNSFSSSAGSWVNSSSILINETVNSSTTSFLIQCTSLVQKSYGSNPVTGLFRIRRDGVFLFNFPFQTNAGSPIFTILTMVQKNIASGQTYMLGPFGSGGSPHYNGAVVKSKMFCVANSDDSYNPAFADQGSGFTAAPDCFCYTQSGAFANAFYFASPGLGYNGSGPKTVIKLTPAGAYDPSFNSAINSILGGGITILVPQGVGASTYILVAGTFTSVNGSTRVCLFRMTSSGAIDTTFTSPTSVGSYNFQGVAINSIIIHPTTGYIYVGGSFGSINGQNRNNFCVFDANGNLL